MRVYQHGVLELSNPSFTRADKIASTGGYRKEDRIQLEHHASRRRAKARFTNPKSGCGSPPPNNEFRGERAALSAQSLSPPESTRYPIQFFGVIAVSCNAEASQLVRGPDDMPVHRANSDGPD
jgi:hypothetical protein